MTIASPPANKVALRAFLRRNPFPAPYTDGLFFRDKMRAIHMIAPNRIPGAILEIGGGQSGLTKMLYPQAHVTVLDAVAAFAQAPANRQPGVHFVTGDATALPFGSQSFDMVTMFDLLEHVEDDKRVAREALRVTRLGGKILLTTPHRERWRYPHFRVFAPISRPEADLFREWGHVRRGYTEEELNALFKRTPSLSGGFINGPLSVSHDIAFSKLKRPARFLLHMAFMPVSLAGYFLNRDNRTGTEIAIAYQR